MRRALFPGLMGVLLSGCVAGGGEAIVEDEPQLDPQGDNDPEGDPAQCGKACEIPEVTVTECPDGQCFADVPPGSAFVTYINELAMLGCVGGYACGEEGEPCDAYKRPYHRPANNIGRGQLSKVMSCAAGRKDIIPPTQQTFQDVPYGSTFWLPIEQLVVWGNSLPQPIVDGYKCGSAPAGVCVPPQNLPYFPPDIYITRAQAVQMINNAIWWWNPGPESNVQHFADVPPGWVYFNPIENAYGHGVITGYACGGAGEPCDSCLRPYFRPNNLLSRGQTAKIIDIAFLHDPGWLNPAPPCP